MSAGPASGGGTVRIRLLIAYDGRPFQGWQSQSKGQAVQDHLERALVELCGSRIVVHGSGRTDAGVHALGQVAHMDVPVAPIPEGRWQHALNSRLPQEIRVLKATRARGDFHARFRAKGKVYVYRIWNESVLHPLEIGRAWHFPVPLDAERLRECARRLEGRHDFAGFAANRGTPVADTVRTVQQITIRRQGALWTLRFRGDGFLYRMVRLLTGTMVRCAQGKAAPEWIDELLEARGRVKTSFAAPAEGLYLRQVLY